MAILDLLSKRNRKQTVAFQHVDLPRKFRIQVIHIWNNSLGIFAQAHRLLDFESPTNKIWIQLHNDIAMEKGLPGLGDGSSDLPHVRCRHYLVTAETDDALDIIEHSFCLLDAHVRLLNYHDLVASGITQTPDEAIRELNYRFRESGIGYQYENGRLVRVDSQFIHAEAVQPALGLLSDVKFHGASDEFLRAFDHHRRGNNKEAIAEALKAFESTLKSICAARRWSYPPNATAKPLVDVILKNGLVPPELETHLGGLRSALETGLPAISNPVRHGQGVAPIQVHPHFAAYALHLCAANIVFLVECHKTKK